MALHKSDEISEGAGVLFRQLQALGLPWLRRCEIHLVDGPTTEVWFSGQKGESDTQSYKVPNQGHAVVREVYKKLEKRKPFSVELSGKKLESFIKYLVKHGLVYPKGEGPSQDGHVINISPFAFGYLNRL